jgi:hypothetical protein
MAALPTIGSPATTSMLLSRTQSFSGSKQCSSEFGSQPNESRRPYSASSLVSTANISISKESIGSSHTGLTEESSFIWLLKQDEIKRSEEYLNIKKTASKESLLTVLTEESSFIWLLKQDEVKRNKEYLKIKKTASKESLLTVLTEESSFIGPLKQDEVKRNKEYLKIKKTTSKEKPTLGHFEDLMPQIDSTEYQITLDQSNLYCETLPKVILQSNTSRSSPGYAGQDINRTTPSYLYSYDYSKPFPEDPVQRTFLLPPETLIPIKSTIDNSPNFKLIPRSAGQRLKLLNTMPTTKITSSAYSDYYLGEKQKVKRKNLALDYNTRNPNTVGSHSIRSDFEKLSYGIMEDVDKKIHSKMRHEKSLVHISFPAHDETNLAVDNNFLSSECPLQKIFEEEIKSYRFAVETANKCAKTIEKLTSQDSIVVLKSMTKILSSEYLRINVAWDSINSHSSLLGGSISSSQFNVKTQYYDCDYESSCNEPEKSPSMTLKSCLLPRPSASFVGLAKLYGTSLMSSAVLDAFPNLVLDWEGLSHTTIFQGCLEELKSFRYYHLLLIIYYYSII